MTTSRPAVPRPFRRWPRRRVRGLLAALGLLALATALLFWPKRPPSAREGAPPAERQDPTDLTDLTDPTDPAESADPRRHGQRAPSVPANPGPERSALADGLNAPAGTLRQDLAILQELLLQYQAVYGENPVGLPEEIVAALAGDNPRGLAFLPPDHPARDPSGQLLDRWGTPFFFHQLSGTVMEVRSAGPDREMYTGDDALLPEPAPLAEE